MKIVTAIVNIIIDVLYNDGHAEVDRTRHCKVTR